MFKQSGFISAHSLIAIALFICIAASLGFLGSQHIYLSPKTAGAQNMLASIFFAQSVTADGLQQKFATGQKINILIVPGHEPDFGGTTYNGRVERDLVLEIATVAADYFKADGRFNVIMSRDANGWNPELKRYFDEHETDITAFRDWKRAEMNRLVSEKRVTRLSEGVPHMSARNDVALRLFGLNKWANEKNIDITLHLHINDYVRPNTSRPGAYTGFTIFVPEEQYSNSAASRALAGNVFTRLSSLARVSTMPREDAGVVPDQELIAIGSNNTVDGVSMLIEYGYIYEPQFADTPARKTLLQSFGRETYSGIRDFFNKVR